MNFTAINFSRHAIERMFERGISPDDVKNVVIDGEVIEKYPDDMPFPSMLILGFAGERPLHVVTALDRQTGNCYVITVYIPDASIWNKEFRTRRA